MVVRRYLRLLSRDRHWLQCTWYLRTVSANADDQLQQYNKGDWLLPAWSIITFTIISALLSVCIGFSK